jgi:hypothetical protein
MSTNEFPLMQPLGGPTVECGQWESINNLLQVALQKCGQLASSALGLYNTY